MEQILVLKTKRINLEIYPFSIIFYLLSGDSQSALGGAQGKAILLMDTKEIGIFLTNKDISVLVHECFHAVEFIMHKIGQVHRRAEEHGDETWAYLLTYLTEEGLDFLK